jgi:VanZ family protein
MHKSSAWPLAGVYAVLIVYASLYPFDQWRDQDLVPWSFVTHPWTPYWSGFDVVSNWLGYAPLGFWLTLGALRSGVQRGTVAYSVTAAAGLSFLLESLQSYLPARVPSLLDFSLNTAGALCGASVAHALEQLGWLDRWSRFRARWFVSDARFSLVALFLWPTALLFPAAVPFGLGQVLERLEDAVGAWLKDTPFLEWLPLRHVELQPLVPGAELLCVMLGLLIPCLLGFSIIRHQHQRLLAVVVVVGMGVAASALSAALSFGPRHAWVWLQLPTWLGMAMGIVVACIMSMLSARACLACLLCVLVLNLAILNQAPASEYFAQTLQTWEQGRFIRFHGVAQWLGWLWPYAVLGLALARAGRSDEGRA